MLPQAPNGVPVPVSAKVWMLDMKYVQPAKQSSQHSSCGVRPACRKRSSVPAPAETMSNSIVVPSHSWVCPVGVVPSAAMGSQTTRGGPASRTRIALTPASPKLVTSVPPTAPSPSVGPHQRLTLAAEVNIADTVAGLAGRFRTAVKSSVRVLVVLLLVIPISSALASSSFYKVMTVKVARSAACQEVVGYCWWSRPAMNRPLASTQRTSPCSRAAERNPDRAINEYREGILRRDDDVAEMTVSDRVAAESRSHWPGERGVASVENGWPNGSTSAGG